MSNFLKSERIARLLLEGFAKRLVYAGTEKNPAKIDLISISRSIEDKFNILTWDVESKLKEEMLRVMIKYMIGRLGRPLRRERREELVRKYGMDLKYNAERRVFARILSVAHEIVHEVAHEKSVEYFELQNLDQGKPLDQISRDVEIEFIYDFLESIAQMFNSEIAWKVSDKYLWDSFKRLVTRFFRQWLEKNRFFRETNFEEAYDRFARAFDRMGESASMNKIFEKFWNLYMKPYARDVVRKDELFKREVEKRFNDMAKGSEIYLYNFIAGRLMGNMDAVFKDRFLITVDILSKISWVVYELNNIDSRSEDIIKIIKKGVLERARQIGQSEGYQVF